MNTTADMTKMPKAITFEWQKFFFQRTDESTSMRHYRLAYAGLYDMGMEARRLKNLRSVNGTTLMLDSTLSDYHDITKNPNLQAEDTVRLYLETVAIKGYCSKSKLIIKIHNFDPISVKLCQNDE